MDKIQQMGDDTIVSDCVCNAKTVFYIAIVNLVCENSANSGLSVAEGKSHLMSSTLDCDLGFQILGQNTQKELVTPPHLFRGANVIIKSKKIKPTIGMQNVVAEMKRQAKEVEDLREQSKVSSPQSDEVSRNRNQSVKKYWLAVHIRFRYFHYTQKEEPHKKRH